MEITESEYQEYQILKRQYGQDEVFRSIDEVSLSEDIDEPIKNCVMAFALLGCNPVWSCCGFDYFGQPIHKFHQYGRCYFILGNVLRSLAVLHEAHVARTPYLGSWQFYLRDNGLDWHFDFKNVIPQWDDAKSIHYSEQTVVYISYLERFLLSQPARFSDKVTIEDTNSYYQKVAPSWQYPPKEPWTFTKEDLMRRVNG